jgi:hypothetical protein
MSKLSAISSGIDGVFTGINFHGFLRASEEFLNGVNFTMASLAQVLAASEALRLGGEAVSAAGRGAIPWPVRAVCYLTPVVINWGCARVDRESHPRMERAFHHASLAFTPLCYGALLASAISLAALGRPLGVATLAACAVEHFLFSRWGSGQIRAAVHRYCGILLPMGTFVFRQGIVRFLSFTVLIDLCIEKALHKTYARVLEHAPPRDLAKIDQFEPPECSALAIEEKHYVRYVPPPPPPPGSQIDALMEEGEPYLRTIEQSPLPPSALRNRDCLVRRVAADEHWKQFVGGTPDLVAVVAYVRKGARLYVDQMKTSGREESIVKARHIVARLRQLPEGGDERFDLWLRLALAGHYCPLRREEETGDVYSELAPGVLEESLDAKVLRALYQKRLVSFQSFLTNQPKEGLIKTGLKIFNSMNPHAEALAELHSYQQALLYLGAPFGLTLPILTERPDLFTHLARLILHSDIIEAKRVFDRQFPAFAYTPSHVIEWLKEAIEEGRIPAPLLYTWLIERYQEAHPEAEREEADQWVREHGYDESGRMERKFIPFLALYFGILNLSQSKGSYAPLPVEAKID